MAGLRSFDHVGITVTDLDAVTAFFVGLGFEVEGRTFLEGAFLDDVCGMTDARTEIVVLRAPGGGAGIELATFIRPDNAQGSPKAMANELGLRSMTFKVDGLRDVVNDLAQQGYGLIGRVGEHEGTWLMASVRGPEGLIANLAEQIA